ncbi:3-dehydroquinate synthase [Halobacillus halophilus]|uniref:3-dehydroquinate synthase n=1 Tax=Halobacillus halophilus (strain ATCC 35676 / DSM 2266 / JCM 20832 / KCTC 3685 / LMG 17431 / NBRC 102448 / NCIMB 2269) TaxID=866895 RepID=I0JNA4_HALH3|nr:3-dehydroquinate synthase [Halobacillus halophilus]ASF39686.1 3-dehydroquinate synthase [Halobacillus halophilus]CCG45624.1 3-dehydroquinate synthase [Halobacillus halophilus DSM 2266]
MSSLTIHANSHDYEVIIEEGIRHELLNYISSDYQKILIITDDKVSNIYLDDVISGLGNEFDPHITIVPAGESSKSMKQYERLLDACVEAQLDRRSLILALGGGMVGDLAGFVASTYLRGIDFIQMPTTILAHDSSVGGKVAINHQKGKNLIGSFYNPVKVIYDTGTLLTLPAEEIRSGYGEVIKHAFLSSPEWCNDLFQVSVGNLSSEQIKDDLMKGIKVKAGIVESDEREKGIRRYLNLGHTLAHAIEAELGYGKITHGEAVGIGLWFALRVSQRKLESSLPVDRYAEWLKSNHYPVEILKNLDVDTLLKRMKWDKKTVHQKINYVLLNQIGAPCVVGLSDQEIQTDLNLFIKEVSAT